ncbi:dTDP-glucose 4,6-dehydratase [Flavobacteriales bacterium]|jgi:dTDP-glucose 4,6-dehydratase|nr:dTDP-glucose 4,6-dehydratase [Flavobacteriales bacterium]
MAEVTHQPKVLLITGGAGFIGSHVVRRWVTRYPNVRIINLDALTYAGNLANLKDIEGAENHRFVKMDIGDTDAVANLLREEQVDTVMHLAAESHVDRSISGPMAFLETNIMGTASLLSACRTVWMEQGGFEGKRFHHVSTDEVYGSLGEEGFFTEDTAYDPRSPYSSSKAASDHIVRAWHHTYGMPIVLSNCSNNYGSFQFPEKLIPLFIRNAVQKKPLPVYGQGVNVRDWLWVEDHASALEVIITTGADGRTYNIGGENEWKNIDLIRLMCRQLDGKLGRDEGETEQLITYVQDRAGHDMRYAIDAARLRDELGWRPSITFEEGLDRTIDWYLSNEAWLNEVTSGAYRDYYDDQYGDR